MKLAQVFANAIVRRVAVVLVALVLSYCGLQPAHAATQCPNAAPYVCDQGQAYADAMRQAAERAAVQCNGVGTTTTRSEIQAFDNGVSSVGGQVRCLNTNGSWGAWGSVGIEAAFYGGKCTARPTDYGGYYQSTIGSKCHEGCSYTLSGITQTETVTDRLGKKYTYNRGNWGPTGAVCASGEGERPPPNSDYCQAVEGGHKVCSNANGQKCVVSGKTGRSYCWTSSESGPATAPTRDESFSKSQPGQPATAPIPREGEDWQQTNNTTVTNNTTNTTTNLAGYNNAGSPNTGTGSGVPGDGSGNTGTGGGDGDGEGDGDGDAGSPGQGVGTLYESDGKTVSDEFAEFWAQAQNTPLVGKVNNFFGNCGYGGSCPVWSYNGGEMMGEVTFDGLCSGALEALFQYGGWIVLAMGAFCAFRIAIY